jgi:hypothetical protein
MAEIFPFRPSEHESVQKLLPWFVNGTLSAHESGLVEAHISECDECHADLTLERQLAHDIATMPRNADDGWNALQSRLAIEAPRHVARSSYRLLRRPVPLGWAMAGSLAASVAVAMAVQQNNVPEKTFHTLGSAPAAAGGEVIVLFRPDTTENQMRVILSAQGARLVDGPTAAGAYVLRIDGDAARAIEALRQSNQIVLAEPLANDVRP